MNKKELKRLKELRDELSNMRDSERQKYKNLCRIGSSQDRIMKVNRSSVSLEMAVDCLDDLL